MIAQEAARGLRVEVGKPGEFENTNADELERLSVSNLKELALASQLLEKSAESETLRCSGGKPSLGESSRVCVLFSFGT
jgi:hypothetical protein